jgi:hypothetical protein
MVDAVVPSSATAVGFATTEETAWLTVSGAKVTEAG